MANRWGISADVEEFVTKRDTNCVYCGLKFSKEDTLRKNKPSWEHIINDIRVNGVDNISLCCVSCNASKGAKLIHDWLESDYCKKKGITFENVALVVKNALLKLQKNEITKHNTAYM